MNSYNQIGQNLPKHSTKAMSQESENALGCSHYKRNCKLIVSIKMGTYI